MSWPFHPLVLAAFFVVSPWAYNLSELASPAMARPLVIVVAATAILFAGMARLLGSAHRGALAASALVMLTCMHGGIVRSAASLTRNSALLGSPAFQDSLAVGLLVLWLVAVVAVQRRAMKLVVATQILNVTSLVWLALPLSTALTHWPSAATAAIPPHPDEPVAAASDGPRPNIVYVVLDAYGRADVLRDFYGHDNGGFVEGLTRKGFHVAARSRANYSQTSLSLASALNMTYLDALAAAEGRESHNRRPLTRMIDDSRLLRVLRARGYRFVTFSSGVAITDLQEPDATLSSPRLLSEFEQLLIGGTAIPSWMRLLRLPDQFDAHRARIEYILDHLADAATAPGPVFVLAHLLCPHPPFVFDEDGGRPSSLVTSPFGFFRDGGHTLARADYVDGYRRQLAFLNRRLDAALSDILARSASPPIIIVQGDHGPGSMMNIYDADETNVRERLSILNAYYFPDRDYRDVWESISPVNSFRVVLNRYFGAALPRLEDRSYFAPWNGVYAFVDVTDRVEEQLRAAAPPR